MKRLFIVFTATIVCSCNLEELQFTDVEGPRLTGIHALPLGHIEYTIRELIEEVNDDQLDLQEDSLSMLYFYYRDTVAFDAANNIITINEVRNNRFIDLPATPPVPVAQVVTVNRTLVFSYPAEDDEEVDSIFYRTGMVTLALTHELNSEVTYTFIIRNTIHESTLQPVILSDSEPSQELSDYKTELNYVDGENSFEVDISLNIFLLPGQSIPDNSEAEIELVFTDQSFDRLYGKFGRDTLQIGNQVLDVAFFEDLGNSGLSFGDPTLTFNFTNGFGLPIGLLFGGVYGVKGTGAEADTANLSGPVTNSAQLVTGASDVNTPGLSTISINRNNSNLRQFLARSPNTIGFDLSAISNPADPTALNFVDAESQITAAIELEMPMEISLRNLSRELRFGLGNGIGFDEADSVVIRIVTENELPFIVELELEIQDQNDSVRYTVAKNIILQSPSINENGFVEFPRKHVADIPVGQVGVEQLNEAGNRLVARVFINTPNTGTGSQTFIKILADYRLKVQLSALGRLNFDL